MISSFHLVAFYTLFACIVLLQVHLLIYSSAVIKDTKGHTKAPQSQQAFTQEDKVDHDKIEQVRKAGVLSHRFQGKTFRYNNPACLDQDEKTQADQDWYRRAPLVVVIGAMKSGTQALSFYLRQHPNIANTREPESHFFDVAFDSFATPEGILKRDARAKYANYVRAQSISPDIDIATNVSLIGLDTTPMYFFWSDVVPSRLFCVAPWVKIILILRDPVDRAFSQYNMMVRRGKTSDSFETWIERDLQRLYSRGVIEKTWGTENRNHAVDVADPLLTGSKGERTAWMNYSGQTSGKFSDAAGSIVGKGLYSIQLQHWWEAMDRANKRRSDMLILNSAEMEENPSKIADRVVNFLSLPSFKLQSDETRHVGNYATGGMKRESREMLQDFYRPYNQQLYKMLGSEWEGAWDK